LVKIFVAFGLILILNRVRVHLSLALIAGSLTLALWMGLGPLEFITSVFNSVSSLQTISLVLIVGLIMVMSRIMEESGHMARMVKSFALLSKDPRTVGTVMSALIGLLPMPGGALFSAPMVEASLSRIDATREQKTALNYWFRHIWEYWWPLYPGVILAVALLEVETWRFISIMAPMTLASLLGGFLFILRPMKISGEYYRGEVTWSGIKRFIWEMLPILIVIAFIMAFGGSLRILGLIGISLEIPSLISILPGLVAAILWVFRVNRTSLPGIRAAIINKNNLMMIFLIIAIMIFKGIMQDSQAVIDIRNELIEYRIPAILLILIMPFLSGFILGIAIGFVGASFPLIIPLFHSPDLLDYLSLAALAYTFGYMGMMLSPVHLCLLVTKDYFKAGLLGSYRYIIIPALTVMLTAVVFIILLRMI
jgi:integral membrane protein (TIGR00529 family)